MLNLKKMKNHMMKSPKFNSLSCSGVISSLIGITLLLFVQSTTARDKILPKTQLLSDLKNNRVAVANSLVVASTDLTNLHKSEFTIFNDTDRHDIQDGVEYFANKNLCRYEDFRNAVGTFTCTKKITYKLTTDASSADIILTRNLDKFAKDKRSIIVYLGYNKHTPLNAAIYLNIHDMEPRAKINFEDLKMRGFIPDPALKEL